MKCPICKKPVAFGDPFMPFCSERCRLLDLGNWASESYVISSPATGSSTSPADLDSETGEEREDR
jgi:uncharacterized protein